MTVETLTLYRHFCLIDSPIPFELVANPTNPDGTEGRDICSRPAGAWVIDCWKLLPEKFFKLNPVFSMNIKYDESLLREGQKVSVRYSDIDIGEGVAGVNGQLVQISPQSLATLEDYVSTLMRLNSAISDSSEVNVVINQENNTTLRNILHANSVATDSLVNVSDNNSVVNKLEQIRTVLKSPAQSSSPWSSILTKLDEIKSITSSGASPIPPGSLFEVKRAGGLYILVGATFEILRPDGTGTRYSGFTGSVYCSYDFDWSAYQKEDGSYTKRELGNFGHGAFSFISGWCDFKLAQIV